MSTTTERNRPHESLGDQTPAQKARVAIPFTGWADLVKASKDWAGAPKEARQAVVDSITPDGYARHKYRRPVQRRKAAKEKKATPSLTQIRTTK